MTLTFPQFFPRFFSFSVLDAGIFGGEIGVRKSHGYDFHREMEKLAAFTISHKLALVKLW